MKHLLKMMLVLTVAFGAGLGLTACDDDGSAGSSFVIKN